MNGNAFYRNHFHKFLIALVVFLFILIGLVIVLLYQVHHRPLPVYLAISPNGGRIQLQYSEEPNMLSVAVLKWATKAATSSYTFDFNQSNTDIRNAIAPYFTDSGWQSYWNALQPTLSTVRKNKLFVSSVVSGAPVISNQGELPGQGIVKRVQLPFLVTFESSDRKTTSSYLLTITIVRVPTTQNPTGMAIDKFVMR